MKQLAIVTIRYDLIGTFSPNIDDIYTLGSFDTLKEAEEALKKIKEKGYFVHIQRFIKNIQLLDIEFENYRKKLNQNGEEK